MLQPAVIYSTHVPFWRALPSSAALTPSFRVRHHEEQVFYGEASGKAVWRMADIGKARTSGAKGADDPYGTGRQARGGGMAPLELVAGEARDTSEGLLGALIELVGADGGSLAGALAAWQREQDRLANRAWRRPGGMARPAGL